MLCFENGDRIVFTGDSVTDAGRGRPVGEGLWEGVGNGYVRSIDTFLNVCYPENLYHISNTGTSGNTSRDLLARWDTDVLALQPDWVSVCIGFNDVWGQFDSPALPYVTVEEFEANLREMIARTKDKVKGMIFLTPYYMEPNPEDSMRKKMDEYGAVVKKVTAEAELPCIDLQKEFCDYLQYRHSSYLMWDRVHPGWIGSLIIARAFLREVGFDRPIL